MEFVGGAIEGVGGGGVGDLASSVAGDEVAGGAGEEVAGGAGNALPCACADCPRARFLPHRSRAGQRLRPPLELLVPSAGG